MPHAHRVSAAICVALAASACRTASDSSLKETEIRSFEGELGMRAGVGYESLYEDVRGLCVDFDGTEPGGTAQTVTYELDLVESHRDLGNSMNVSQAAQVKASIPDTPATVSAKTKFMLGHSFTLNRYSVFLMAKVEVRNETTQLKNARLKSERLAELANAASDRDAIDRFRLQCGDAYLASYTTGGEFFGVIEIETDSEEQKSELQSEIEANIGLPAAFDASVQSSFEAKLSRATRNRNVKIWTYQRGGSGAEQVGLVDTAEQMIQRVRAFPSFVTAASGSNAANHTATFKDYFTLSAPLSAEYRDQLYNAQDVMSELAGIQTQLIDRRGDIDYILAHANSFEGVTPGRLQELRAIRDANDQLMRKIWRAARDCHRRFRDCRVPDEIASIPRVELPARKSTVASITQAMIQVRTKLQTIDIGALSDGPWNPPDCLIEIRAKAPDGRYRRIRRTPPDFNKPRCDELDGSFDLPQALLTESFRALGIDPARGIVELLVLDDDVGADDEVIGRIEKGYADITTRNAIVDTLTGPHVTMAVEFEVR
jgi:hypothetical protein